jgi:hypothetical protein
MYSCVCSTVQGTWSIFRDVAKFGLQFTKKCPRDKIGSAKKVVVDHGLHE